MKLKDDIGGKPMMADKEIEIINNIIFDLKPKKCLEWGSGNSTVYFPKTHSEIEEWMAIEHDKTYLELLEKHLPKNSYITIVGSDGKYESYPKTLGKIKYFDFILVDGIRRDECLDMAFQYIKDDGIILLHDAGREESKYMLEKYKNKVVILCEGELMQSSGYYAHRGIAKFLP